MRIKYPDPFYNKCLRIHITDVIFNLPKFNFWRDVKTVHSDNIQYIPIGVCAGYVDRIGAEEAGADQPLCDGVAGAVAGLPAVAEAGAVAGLLALGEAAGLAGLASLVEVGNAHIIKSWTKRTHELL